jgi:hypothetical protein
MEKVNKLPDVILSQAELEKYGHHLNIGTLKKMIEDMPDDGLVLVQRIEDFYYEKNGWGVVLKEGEHYHHAKSFNADVAAGEYDHIKENMKQFSEGDLDLIKEQYHPAWCVVKYEDDDKNLYLDLHY